MSKLEFSRAANICLVTLCMLPVAFCYYLFRIKSNLPEFDPGKYFRPTEEQLLVSSERGKGDFEYFFRLPKEYRSDAIDEIVEHDGALWMATEHGLLTFSPQPPAQEYSANLYRAFPEFPREVPRGLTSTPDGLEFSLVVSGSNNISKDLGPFHFSPRNKTWQAGLDVRPGILRERFIKQLDESGWKIREIPGGLFTPIALYADGDEFWSGAETLLLQTDNVSINKGPQAPQYFKRETKKWIELSVSTNGYPLASAASVHTRAGMWLLTGNSNAPLLLLDRKTKSARSFGGIPEGYWPAAVSAFRNDIWISIARQQSDRSPADSFFVVLKGIEK